MDTITVPKDRLLATIQANRTIHRDQFLQAQTVYRAKVIDLLDQRLEAVRKGERIDLVFALPEPQDYTDSYITAIKMLEWETKDVVELDQGDFRRYVENKWEWARAFAQSTQSYLAS